VTNMITPYIIGTPIEDPANFYGRERQVKQFFDRITGYKQLEPMRIIGVRRSGKTSYLKYISNKKIINRYVKKEDSRNIIAYVNLERNVNSPEKFYSTVYKAICKHLPGKSDYNIIEPPNCFDDFDEWLENLLEDDLRIIILLDEFGRVMNSNAFDIHFFLYLRSITSSQLVWVLSLNETESELSHRNTLGEKTSYFFNVFNPFPIYIDRLEIQEAYDLIRKPLEGTGIQLEQEDFHHIIRIAGRLPYFLQAVADCWIRFKKPGDTYSKTAKRVIDEIYQPDNSIWKQFGSYWKRLSAEGKASLSMAAAGTSREESINSAGKMLMRYGLLAEQEEKIEIDSELFKKWILDQEEGGGSHPKKEAIRVLHISDLHIKESTATESILQPLIEDLEDPEDGLDTNKLDYLVVTGDLTHQANKTEFEKAEAFLSELKKHFQVPDECCIVCPGNHDLDWNETEYAWKSQRQVTESQLEKGKYVEKKGGYLVRTDEKYHLKFENFSESLYFPLTGNKYPLPFNQQCIPFLFPEHRLLLMTLNSSWEIDEYFENRSGIDMDALSKGLKNADLLIEKAMKEGKLSENDSLLKIAVFHHPVTGNEKIEDEGFLDRLKKIDFKLCLHGHVHEERADLFEPFRTTRKLHIVGTGSLDAPSKERPESIPRLYNLLEIEPDHSRIHVHTRCKQKNTGAWTGWAVWPVEDEPHNKRTYYDILLK
jgi:predicted MPP superfamily phosphohydrolase